MEQVGEAMVTYGYNNHIGPGSGNHWSDGLETGPNGEAGRWRNFNYNEDDEIFITSTWVPAQDQNGGGSDCCGFELNISFGAQAGFNLLDIVGVDVNVANVEIYTTDKDKNNDGKLTVSNSVGINILSLIGYEIGQEQKLKSFNEGASSGYVSTESVSWLGYRSTKETGILGNTSVSNDITVFDFKLFLGIELIQKIR